MRTRLAHEGLAQFAGAAALSLLLGCRGTMTTPAPGALDGSAPIELPPGILATPIAGAVRLPTSIDFSRSMEMVLDPDGNAFVRSWTASSIVLTRFDRTSSWGPPVTIQTNAIQDGAAWANLFMDVDGAPTVLWGPDSASPLHAHRFMGAEGWGALPAADPTLKNDLSFAVGGHGQIALFDTRLAHDTSGHQALPELAAQVFDPVHGWSAVSVLYTASEASLHIGIASVRAVVASDGTVLALWNDQRDLWARYSADAGWSTPAELTDCLSARLLADHAGNVVAVCSSLGSGLGIRRFVNGSWSARETLQVQPAGTEMAMANGAFLFILPTRDTTLRLARVSGAAVQELTLTRGPRWAGISNVALDPRGGVVILWEEEVPKEPLAGHPDAWRGPVRHLFYGRAEPGHTDWSRTAQLDGDDGVSTGAYPAALAINDHGQAMALWINTVIDKGSGAWLAPLP
jgi:hypothetical protein